MPVELTESSSASSHAVARGDEVVLTLAESPTTGYRWEVALSGVGELQLTDDRFIPGAGVAVPGAAGHRVLRFRAQKPGAVQLAAAKRREWEAIEAAIERRAYSIVIT